MAKSENDNAFDLIRLVLAIMVVYTHASLIGGFGLEGFLRLTRDQLPAGSLAVLGFFGISGFLVTRSFILRGDGWHFLRARVLRIFPGFWAALIVTAFVCAPLCAHFNAAGGPWHFADAARFVGRNASAAIFQWNIGSVLVGLPSSGSINGALWSLLPEICCYALVLALGLAGSLRKGSANLAAIAVVIVVTHVALITQPDKENLAPTLLQLTKFTPYVLSFVTGMLMYRFWDAWNVGARQALLWWLGVAVLLKFGGVMLLGPILLPIAIIHTAYAFQVKLPADLSYGIYVLHFPILQVLVALQLNKHGFALYFAVGLALTAAAATVSWFGIERPALRLKGRKPAAA